MRLKLLSPSALSPEQRPLYDDMRKGIETNFKGFTAIGDGGELIGPWNLWLHFPKFGKPGRAASRQEDNLASSGPITLPARAAL